MAREIKTLTRDVSTRAPTAVARQVGLVGASNQKSSSDEEVADLEGDLERQMRDLDRNLNESMKDVGARIAVESESEYWCVLVFQSDAQKLAFLGALHWNLDRDGSRFIDGRLVAERMKIALPKGVDWKLMEAKVKARMASMALPIELPPDLRDLSSAAAGDAAALREAASSPGDDQD